MQFDSNFPSLKRIDMASSTEGKTEEIASTDQPGEDLSTWFKETYPKSKATFIVFYRGYW